MVRVDVDDDDDDVAVDAFEETVADVVVVIDVAVSESLSVDDDESSELDVDDVELSSDDEDDDDVLLTASEVSDATGVRESVGKSRPESRRDGWGTVVVVVVVDSAPTDATRFDVAVFADDSLRRDDGDDAGIEIIDAEPTFIVFLKPK